MATISVNGDVVTVTLSSLESKILATGFEAQLEQYITAWLKERVRETLVSRFQLASAPDKATVLAKLGL